MKKFYFNPNEAHGFGVIHSWMGRYLEVLANQDKHTPEEVEHAYNYLKNIANAVEASNNE